MTDFDASRDGSDAAATMPREGGSIEGRSTLGTVRVAGFYLLVLATIGLFVYMLGELLAFAFTGWTAQGAAVLGHHQFHDTVFATMMGIALLGLAIQLYRPRGKLLGVLGYLVVVALLGVIFAVVGSEEVVLAAIFGGLGLGIAALHPDSGSIRRFALPERLDPVVSVLVLVAAVPLLAYFVDQFALQAAGVTTVDHAIFGHYAAMAAVAGSILVLSVAAVLAPAGWRIAAVGASLLALVWGIASVAFPGQESSGGLLWGALAIGWSVAFVLATEYAHRGDVPAERSEPQAPRPA